jgi:hypothetical protein
LATATKLKVCKRFVHNGTERVACNLPYVGEDCAQKDQHVLKIKTGYCANGYCEGTKPKSWRGTPVPTCKFFATCACECHVRFDEIFKIAGEPRILIENAEYIPDLIEFHIEDYMNLGDSSGALNPDGADGSPSMERPVESQPARSPVMLASRRTDTGRAARGGLEAQVWDLCRVFMSKGMEGLVTPKLLAEAIADHYKIPTPSTGAIGAVFDRWEKLGFAKQAKKPVRFMGFEGKGTWEELQILKGKTKRERKASQSAARRGFR